MADALNGAAAAVGCSLFATVVCGGMEEETGVAEPDGGLPMLPSGVEAILFDFIYLRAVCSVSRADLEGRVHH